MFFTKTELSGVFLITLDLKKDNRGFFARSFCAKEFADNGLISEFVQCNISYNHKQGTLRGLHYQAEPFSEVKVVRCIKGAIYDVVLDIRPFSHTYKKWLSFELSESNYQMLYIPQGVAHGFQTLQDDTEILYFMSQFYTPDSARGIHWDDPEFHIEWPLTPKIISDKDQAFPKGVCR